LAQSIRYHRSQSAWFHPRRLRENHGRIGRRITMAGIARWLNDNTHGTEIARKSSFCSEVFHRCSHLLLEITEHVHELLD
jgi:hypothetical protein